MIEVLDVNYGEDYFNNIAEDGILRISWFSSQAANFGFGDAIALIQIRLLTDMDASTRYFELEANTELADRIGTAIRDIKLETTALATASGDMFITNYPNPFSSTTNISYNLPEAANVTLVVYNKLGQVVETLVSARQDAGSYQVVFGRPALNAGVYFYKIVVEGETKTFTQTNSMVIVK
jgi:hypothetical protein